MENPETQDFIPRHLPPKRKQMIIDFIHHLDEERIFSSHEIIDLICKMTAEPNIFYFKSNSQRTMIQVGGNYLYLAIVCLIGMYQSTFFIGNFTDDELKKFKKIKLFFSKNGIIFSQYQKGLEIKNAESLVISILSIELIPDWLRAKIPEAETFILKEFIEQFPGFHIFSENLSLKFGNFTCYLIIETNFRKSHDLDKLLILEEKVFTSREKLSSLLRDFISRYDHFQYLEPPETIINRISNHFLTPNLSKFLIVLDFCKLVMGLLVKARLGDDEIFSDCLEHAINCKIITWIVFFVIHRTILSSFLLTIFLEKIRIKEFMISFTTMIRDLTAVKVPEDYQLLISQSFISLIESNSSVVKLLKKLDTESDLLENDLQDGERKKEISEVIKLIPSYVLCHSKSLDIIGKTLMGGIITLSSDLIPFSKSSKIKDASFLIVIRHEICHKKWYLNGSGRDFFKRTPPFKDFCFQEAGTYLDSLALGEISCDKDFFPQMMTEEIATKITSNIELNLEEREAIFIDKAKSEKMKSFGASGSRPRRRMLCQGRIFSYENHS